METKKRKIEPIYYSPDELESYRLYIRGYYSDISSLLYLRLKYDYRHVYNLLLEDFGQISHVLFYVPYEDLPLSFIHLEEDDNDRAVNRTIMWRLINGK